MSELPINPLSPTGKILKTLSRESSSGKFIPEIDGLRFIAIASVVLYHMNGYVAVKTGRDEHLGIISSFLDKGNFGVQLFFVISGFIIAYPFASRILAGRRPPSLRKYYTRRLTRLEPPYVLNLLVVFALLVFVLGKSASELLPHLAASMFYQHNLVFGKFSQINCVAWSLEIEFQFYLLAPFLVMVFKIRSKWLRRAFLAAAIGGASILGREIFQDHPRLALSFFYYSNYFLVGFLLADVYILDWGESPRACKGWDVASALAWLAIIELLLRGGPWRSLLPAPVFVAYMAAFRGRMSRWLFSRPPIYVVGGMCYTIYLYHFYVISLIGRVVLTALDPGEPFWVNISCVSLMSLPAILVFCCIMFALGEKPFMKKDWHIRFFHLRSSLPSLNRA